jgi:two-component system, NarL family, nitrate/nitrite response regulator NarL
MTRAAGRISVVVADDHPLYRDGVVESMKDRPELEVAGEATDGRAALDAIRSLAPDVAVIDVRMPGLEGMEVLNAVRREELDTKVIFLSAFLDGEVGYKAVAAGASGYLSKESDSKQICEAIVRVARGETVLAPEIQSGLANAIRAREDEDRPILTPREREILALIAEGYSAPEIGERIHLSPATVKTHLQHLYEKLGVSERAAAVAEAMRRGLLE